MVKNLPTVQQIQDRSLGREGPLEKGMATHSAFLPENSVDRGAWRAVVHGGGKVLDMTEQLTHTHTHTRTRTRTHRHTDDFTGRLYQISEEEIKSISHDLFQQTGGNTFQNVLSLVLP